MRRIATASAGASWGATIWAAPWPLSSRLPVGVWLRVIIARRRSAAARRPGSRRRRRRARPRWPGPAMASCASVRRASWARAYAGSRTRSSSRSRTSSGETEVDRRASAGLLCAIELRVERQPGRLDRRRLLELASSAEPLVLLGERGQLPLLAQLARWRCRLGRHQLPAAAGLRGSRRRRGRAAVAVIVGSGALLYLLLPVVYTHRHP